jgi:hypothetical protein
MFVETSLVVVPGEDRGSMGHCIRSVEKSTPTSSSFAARYLITWDSGGLNRKRLAYVPITVYIRVSNAFLPVVGGSDEAMKR